MKLFFDNEDFDGQFLRALSYTAYSGADIGECFETASTIKEGDRTSWYEAFTKTADRLRQDAEESLENARKLSARRSYLRASNYYRAAEPDQPHNTQASLRLDFNPSESDRFFVRVNGNKFLESSLVDWTTKVFAQIFPPADDVRASAVAFTPSLAARDPRWARGHHVDQRSHGARHRALRR